MEGGWYQRLYMLCDAFSKETRPGRPTSIRHHNNQEHTGLLIDVDRPKNDFPDASQQ